MLGVEQTESGRALSTFCTEKWKSVSKMDLGKLDFSPPPNRQQGRTKKKKSHCVHGAKKKSAFAAESSADTREKNCNVYP